MHFSVDKTFTTVFPDTDDMFQLIHSKPSSGQLRNSIQRGSIAYRITVLRPKDCWKRVLENMYIAIWAQYSYRSCGVLHSFYTVPSIALYVPLSNEVLFPYSTN